MSVVKRFNELLDLDEIDVFIDEVDKSRHIILSDIPDSLPQGRSSFLIETSPFMKQDTEIQIDFIDSEGASIYTEPIADYLEGRARRVSVEVYDDTAPGIATLVIVGELVAVPDGNTIFADAEQVPKRFQGAYNVRLTKQIVINPTAVNTQPIKFFGQPIISVTETRLGTMVRTDVTGSITSSLFDLEAVPTDENLLFQPFGSNLNPSQGLLSEGAPSSPAKQRSLKAYVESRKRKNRKGKRKNSVFKRSGLLSKTNSPPTFPYRIRPGSFNGEESFRFDTSFIGGEVHFHESSLGNTFTNTSFYPQAALTEAGLLETPTFDTEKEQGIVNTSASMYTASIVDLVSDRIIAVDKPFTNKNVNGEDIILPIFARGQIHYEAMPTASYAEANLISYANVTLADMRTFSGDVYKVKVYVKSEGGFDDYKLLAEVPLEGKELLVDDASVGQGDRTGYFIEQGDIDNFWTVSGSVNGESVLGTPATNAAYNNDIMLDSVKLSGSLANSTDHLKFQLNDEYKFELIKGVDYNLSIDVIGNRSGSNYATLVFYISGSSMNKLDNLFYDEYADTEVVESSKYGKRLGTLTIKPEDDVVKDFQTVAQTFTPDITGDGVLQIRVLQGVWNIGDIAIGPAADTGFNPSLFQFKQEMPAELSHKRPDTFEFMAEFYDVNNNLSDTIAYKSGVQFTGTNMTITGEDNVLESNLFIGGDTTGSGMHLGGVTSTLPETGTAGAAGSGFMRSVGYEGFISASNPALNGRFGFMIYSGSVLPDSGDDYKGVGLELVGASGSLKFRTNPSVFDVRADSFFVGRKHENSATGVGQFMSGSGGNIEISSSLFHLDPINDRLIIGAGTTIRAELTANTIRTPAEIGGVQSTALNASSSIDAQGLARFASASIAGFTVNPIAIHSDDNNLVMSASGQITGSDVLFTGGKIAAFSLSDDAFSTDNFFISASATGNDFFISSSNFQVTAEGDLSGSQVTFTGGDVAGWTISENTLQGGNLILSKEGSIRSSNYQSDVAGFIITAEENGFAEFENIKVRGTLATTTFEKESVNAVGGQLFVANSTALTGSAITAAETTMSVVNSSGFENGEILVIKKITDTGFNTEYVRVDSASLDGDLSKDEVHGRIYVTRSIAGTASENSSSIGDPIGTAQDYEPGQVLVSSGKIGTGYIRLNANPNNQATPYIDIIERTGSGVYDVQLKARLGDLKGVAGTRNVPENFDGFGLMSEVAFLSGSNIKLEAPTFLLGDLNQNFVSGSNSNMEISSSRFHLSPNGDLKIGRTETSSSVTSYNALVNASIGTSDLQSHFQFEGTLGASVPNDGIGSTALTKVQTSGASLGYSSSQKAIGSVSLKVSQGASIWKAYLYALNTGNAAAPSEISFSFWFRSPNVTGATRQLLVAQANSSVGFTFSLKSSYLIFGGYNANSDLFSIQQSVSSNTWYHVVGTWNEGDIVLYLNGSEVGSEDGSDMDRVSNFNQTETHILNNNSAINLPAGGTLNGANSETLQALASTHIDDVRIYKDALSPSEISTLYSTSPTGITNTFFEPAIDFDNSNSDLKLNTKKFFLGQSTTNFVSGSNGNMEISSSNFHLSANGDVVMQGKVTANEGAIGGLTLSSTGELKTGNFVISGSLGGALKTSETGRRVEILGSDNSLKFYSGSIGTRVISLSDAESIYSIVPNFAAHYTSSALLFENAGGAMFKTPEIGSNGYLDYNNVNAYLPITIYQPTSTTSHGGIFIGTSIMRPAINFASNNGNQTIGHYLNFEENGTGQVYGSYYDINAVGSAITGLHIDIGAPNGGSDGDVQDIRGIDIDIDRNTASDSVMAIRIRDDGTTASTDRYGIRIDMDSTVGSDEHGYGLYIDNDVSTDTGYSYGLYIIDNDRNLIEGQTEFIHGILTDLIPYADNVIDLGTSSKRWDDVRASNGTIQTSDRNLKTQISGSDLGLNFINRLNPVKYKWISGSRTHYGLIAQEVSQSLKDLSIGIDNFAGYTLADNYEKEVKIYKQINEDKDAVKEKLTEKEILADESLKIGTGSLEFEYDRTKIEQAEKSKIEKDTSKYGDLSEWTYVNSEHGLRYNEFIAPLIKSIQELTRAHNNLVNAISNSTDLNDLKASVTGSLI